jgi:hypothetical protein
VPREQTSGGGKGLSGAGNLLLAVCLTAVFIVLAVFSVSAYRNCAEAQHFTSCSAYGCFIIKNASGSAMAIIDGVGAVDISGSVLWNSIGTPNGRDFVIKNSTGSIIFWIDDTNGNMRSTGTYFDLRNTSITPPAGSFVVKNKTGVAVSFIGPNGSIWSLSELCYNANI